MPIGPGPHRNAPGLSMDGKDFRRTYFSCFLQVTAKTSSSVIAHNAWLSLTGCWIEILWMMHSANPFTNFCTKITTAYPTQRWPLLALSTGEKIQDIWSSTCHHSTTISCFYCSMLQIPVLQIKNLNLPNVFISL
ncbi:unnamed protein product [Ranitomeya imitator]|uniref:Uncharacterized protein n=1 Tax=Ranitomeya imitator TaxID=111125 RepID=A0ABN9M2S3_9NEOB|nr:unnamed protein product [Ranitomeya imitator]